MKKLLLASSLVLSLATATFADTFTLTSINGGAATGSTLYNFDNLNLGSATQSVGGLTLGFGSSAKVVTGSVNLQYAAPYLSGSNGNGFGNPGNQPDGIDATKYLSAGTSSITFSFDTAQKYMGLLWGSVDKYNTLEFFNGDTLLKTYTGADVWGAANGDQGAQGTYYVNINDLDGTFTKVVASSTTNSFEIDNVALDTKNRVPDSGATVAMLGLTLIGLAALRRKA